MQNIFFKLLYGVLLLAASYAAGPKVYAWQEISGARVISYGILSNEPTYFLIIDRDHHVTTQTSKCLRRRFAWNSSAPNAHQFFHLVAAAYAQRNFMTIRIRYSEYQCYPTSQGPFMSVIFIAGN